MMNILACFVIRSRETKISWGEYHYTDYYGLSVGACSRGGRVLLCWPHVHTGAPSEELINKHKITKTGSKEPR